MRFIAPFLPVSVNNSIWCVALRVLYQSLPKVRVPALPSPKSISITLPSHPSKSKPSHPNPVTRACNVLKEKPHRKIRATGAWGLAFDTKASPHFRPCKS